LPTRRSSDLELALELERCAEQHRDHASLGQEPGNRLRIGVARQYCVEHGAELHGTTPYVERIDLEGNDMIVSGMVEFAESGAPFGQGHGFRHGVSPAVCRARQVW